ncbi:MAG: hypothetical protein JPMHGGIA_00784 [Saprospiraceae bacterium]|jgi:hypothetical protein|nr:hypothetical protein [Saprospiraceae bacterium]
MYDVRLNASNLALQTPQYPSAENKPLFYRPLYIKKIYQIGQIHLPERKYNEKMGRKFGLGTPTLGVSAFSAGCMLRAAVCTPPSAPP